MEKEIIITQQDANGIATILLNRPEVHNAFDDHLIHELTEVLLKLEKSSTTKVIILSANGKHFSSGADLEWMKKMANNTSEENLTDALQFVKLLKILHGINKPTIALTKGMAMGGGIGLLSCCDMVIAEREARFCFSEAKLGLVPATIAPYVIKAIGQRAALYYFLTTKFFSATEAKSIGLVHEVVPEKDLILAGTDLAKTILKNGPEALAIIKKLVSQFNSLDETSLAETAEIIAKVRASKEAEEGLNAFFQKRAPEWQM